jgi:hypothetical protein
MKWIPWKVKWYMPLEAESTMKGTLCVTTPGTVTLMMHPLDVDVLKAGCEVNFWLVHY